MSVNFSEEIKIKEADLGKAEQINTVVKKAFNDYKQGKHNPDLEEDIEDIKNDIKKNIVLILQNQDNQILGTLRLVPENSNKVYLKKFAILPEYQNFGFGSLLFKKAKEIARGEGYKKVYLHSSTEDKNLVNFYKKLGFKCIEINKDMGYRRGLWVKKIC